HPPTPTLFPYTTLFRSEPSEAKQSGDDGGAGSWRADALDVRGPGRHGRGRPADGAGIGVDRSAGGDRGMLWIADGLLWFAGRRRSEEHTSELQSLAYLV